MIKNFGLLMGVDWNSNKWADVSTEEDLKMSDFGFVQENALTYSCLNFGHLQYPADKDGYYGGLLPQLWTKTLDRDKALHVQVVFLKSKDYASGKTYIIGFYAYPMFQRGTRPSPIASFTSDFIYNVKSKPEHIHLCENYLDITDPRVQRYILPRGKDLGTRGFNYLGKQEVLRIFDRLGEINKGDGKLNKIKLALIRTTVN